MECMFILRAIYHSISAYNFPVSRFRWVALHLADLRDCLYPKAVTEQLESLPAGLDETYAHILLKIAPRNRADAKRLLGLISFAARPFTVDELSEAIMVDFDVKDGPIYNPQRKYTSPRDVLIVCSGLVTISEGTIIPFINWALSRY